MQVKRDPHDNTLNVQVSYRGLKNNDGTSIIDMFTTTGNYQSCKKNQKLALSQIAKVNDNNSTYFALDSSGLDLHVVKLPKLVFVKGKPVAKHCNRFVKAVMLLIS